MIKSAVDVSNIEETPIVLKAGPHPHLVAQQNIQTRFKMHISNVNNAEANAIRRTLACELPVHALAFEYEDMETDDLHLIREMIQKRMRMIPLNQEAPTGVYTLTCVNNTMLPMDVKTVLIDKNGKQCPYVNATITLLTLQPGKSVKIKNIHHVMSYGYIEGHGMHTLTWQCTSIATDIAPLNVHENTGKPAHESAPREWDIQFGTNGTLPGKACVQLACQELIKRLDQVATLMSKIRSDENRYTLDIPNESDTIGNLIVAAATEMFPQLQSAVYSVPTTDRICTLRIAYDEDINTFFNAIIEREQALFHMIASKLA
jgi:DNA-directed RNA polymerase subunit L